MSEQEKLYFLALASAVYQIAQLKLTCLIPVHVDGIPNPDLISGCLINTYRLTHRRVIRFEG